jgi:hypothetical protein
MFNYYYLIINLFRLISQNALLNAYLQKLRICDLFNLILHLKKVMSKGTFILFQCSMGDFTCRFYCCRRPVLSIRALLCNNKYLHIFSSDMLLKNTHNMHRCVSTATMVPRTRHFVTLYVRTLSSYEQCLNIIQIAT